MLSFGLKIYCTAPSHTAKPAVDVTQAAVSPGQIPGTPRSFHRGSKAPETRTKHPACLVVKQPARWDFIYTAFAWPLRATWFRGVARWVSVSEQGIEASARADQGPVEPVDRAWQCNSSAQAPGEASCVLSLVGCIDRVSACLMKENMAILSLECQLCFSALKIQLGVPQSNVCLPAGWVFPFEFFVALTYCFAGSAPP